MTLDILWTNLVIDTAACFDVTCTYICVNILDRCKREINYVDVMLACAGGLDHTRGSARPSDLGLSQHNQGIPRKELEYSGDAASPHTVPGSAGLLQGLQSAAVGRAESSPLAGVLPLVLFLLLQLPTLLLCDELQPLSCQQAMHTCKTYVGS